MTLDFVASLTTLPQALAAEAPKLLGRGAGRRCPKRCCVRCCTRGSYKSSPLSKQLLAPSAVDRSGAAHRLVELLTQVAWAVVRKQRQEAARHHPSPAASLSSYVPQVVATQGRSC